MKLFKAISLMALTALCGACSFIHPKVSSSNTDLAVPVDKELLTEYRKEKLINTQDSGYRGIWYKIGETKDEYVHKYSGGLGTYPANHYPFSVYVPKVNKTFFCYGGSNAANSTLYHQVSYFDHKTGEVPRPTIVLDKATTDAHDNPVIQVDKDGYIWLFSTAHGKGRPSFIHRSAKPYDISKFVKVNAIKIENGKKVRMDNFSYLQMYYTEKDGFIGLFTSYEVRQLALGKQSCRDIAYMTSKDGVEWSEWKFLAQIDEGSYQTSGQWKDRIGTAFNYHPNRKVNRGLDFRTNLYFMYTDDNGKTWRSADGNTIDAPLKTISNQALIHDYSSEGLNVYVNDVNYDKQGNPIILYEAGKGHAPGPANGMKQWYTAYWNGGKWDISSVATSDHNYDMGSLYVEKNGNWKVIGPTENGPQFYNTGGEITMLVSKDKGKTWTKERQITKNSAYNHSYPRRPVNADKDFYAFWADGNGRAVSKSRLYFSDQEGNAYMLPEKMTSDKVKPTIINAIVSDEQLSDPKSIYKVMKRVADWQIDSLNRKGFRHQPRDWTNGALYAGLLKFAELANDNSYYGFMREKIGEKYNWQLYDNDMRYHADFYCVGQMYSKMYEIYKDPQMIADLQMLADTLIARPHTESLESKNRVDKREWSWCDALFMAPPSLAMLAKVSGKAKYLDLCDQLWMKTSDYLYDKDEHLFYRDSRYFKAKEKNGEKVFWSRGNGWVIGGLVRVLDNMPSDYSSRPRWIKQYKEMATKIASIQQPDGTWHASLLDPQSFPVKETSGTGFFCYALAWGINNGVLDQKTYGPLVWKAWRAMNDCVHPDGMLGFVQRIGDKPADVKTTDTEVYGVGAFLLAGSEVLKMSMSNRVFKPSVTLTNAGSANAKVAELLDAAKAKRSEKYQNLLNGTKVTPQTPVSAGTTIYLQR